MIAFGPEVCRDLEAALSREWLETNGLGGFASSTLCGLNTRRYHALLVAATQPPVGRCVLLSKLEETLVIDGERSELSANQYPGVVHPQGFMFLKAFRLEPFPIFTYEVKGVELEKAVFMVQGEDTTVVQYTLKSGPPQKKRDIRLEVRPLIAFRDYHSTAHENGSLNAAVEQKPGLASIAPYGPLPRLYFGHDAEQVNASGAWYRNFEYRVEQERGLDFREDLFNPLTFTFDLSRRSSATVVASTVQHESREAAGMRRAEEKRRQKLASTAPGGDDLVNSLTVAADQYIVARGEHRTVIAGYPWFADWGRDTMIALPGLTLVTGRFDVARDILLEFSKHVSQGMLPNRFTDAGEAPEYNTVDATLWFFEAIRSYATYTGDYDFVRQLYPTLVNILGWHVRGTRYGIHVDPSGLLASGEPGVQLTWMDAKIGDWVVTPRSGKAVEIQALWYNALCVMADFAQRFADAERQKKYLGMASVLRWSFNRLFWNEAKGCLYDVVNGGPPDGTIRPNQVLAVSLPCSMLTLERAKKVVDVVERELLTPYGLRTLPRSDPRYVPHYVGDARTRDASYHQGTVWPWLLGPFLTAYIKVNGGDDASRAQARKWLEPLQQHLAEAGLGQISEIFDAEPPHTARGCFAQAWSVGEVLRALAEDVHGRKVRGDAAAAFIERAAARAG